MSNLALLDVLRLSGLLTSEQIGQLPRPLTGRLTDARKLARVLLQKGWLTVYQMNQLLAGNGAELVLGPYHILDRIGQGGQSTVYKARHADEEYLVALKVIRAELLSNSEASRQFLVEMEAMAKLDHPNVVQFLDADQVGETYYCAMEYVEGTDLGKYVRLVGPLPAPEACTYIRQAALGLQHAHEHSLIHRDIKPVNLYLTGELVLMGSGQAPVGALVKLLDWGLAGLRPPCKAEAAAASRSEAGTVVGTADYLSPDQALNPTKVDIRGDIYSLGCTFYYLLTGQPPFPGGSLMQKILRHQKEEPTPVDLLRPDLPLGLDGVLRRMMAKKPEDRYQTPASVAIALAPFCRPDLRPVDPERAARPRPDRQPGGTVADTPTHATLDTDHTASSGS